MSGVTSYIFLGRPPDEEELVFLLPEEVGGFPKLLGESLLLSSVFSANFIGNYQCIKNYINIHKGVSCKLAVNLPHMGEEQDKEAEREEGRV